jgi:hypothetical protein
VPPFVSWKVTGPGGALAAPSAILNSVNFAVTDVPALPDVACDAEATAAGEATADGEATTDGEAPPLQPTMSRAAAANMTPRLSEPGT